MILRISSMGVRAKVFFPKVLKPRLNICAVSKNCRFFNDARTENEPAVWGLPRHKSRNKKFKEALYFKNVMENNPKYPDLAFNEEILKANESSTNKLVTLLRNAVNNKISQNNEWDNFELKSDLTEFESDEYTMHDMIELFHLLKKYCELYSKPVELEMSKLSDLIKGKIETLKKMKKDVGLVIALLNSMKEVTSSNTICFYLVKYPYSRFKLLTTIQLVEYFYLLHFFKIFYGAESKFEFELFVVNAMRELNMDEVAVISYAFFRSRLRPGSSVAAAIAQRVLEDIESLNDIQACTTFKFLKFSGRRRISEHLTKIFDKCVPILDKFNITTATHIISSGVSVNTEHKELFQRVWDRAVKEFDQLRMKDVERLLLTSLYTNFPVTEDSDFVQLTIQKFTKDNPEIKDYPTSFFSLITYLINHNIYLEDLIKNVLSDEYMEVIIAKFGKKHFHQALFIEASVALERPEYELTKMPEETRKKLFWASSLFREVNSSSARCNAMILNALEEMYDKESVVNARPLVHYVTLHPILCINRNNEPQKIGDELRSLNRFSLIRAPKDGNLYIAFVLLRWQSCLNDKVTPNLVSEAKLRQFRLAGYIPVTVHNFLILPKTNEELKQFLSEAIKDKIQSVNS